MRNLDCLNGTSEATEDDTNRLESLKLDDTPIPIWTEHHHRSQAHRGVTDLRWKATKASKAVKPYLGHVYAASGYRQEGVNWPMRLDWALIEIEGSRAAASKEQISLCDRAEFPLDKDMTDLYRYWKEVGLNNLVYKFARTTQATEGLTGIFAAVYRFSDVEHDGEYPVFLATYEQAVLTSTRFGRPFAKVGDAGSLVFTDEGEFAGLVIGGNTVTGSTYLTLRDPILKDIKKITGAKEICLPIEAYFGARREGSDI